MPKDGSCLNGITTAALPEQTSDVVGDNSTTTLTEDHRLKLKTKYGINVSYWENHGVVKSCDAYGVALFLGKGVNTEAGSGICIQYPDPETGTTVSPVGPRVVRLDVPIMDKETGRARKYLYPYGQPCTLFNPGVNLTVSSEIWITEGAFKSMCGFDHGLPVVALGGLWNWKNHLNGNKVSDEAGLLPELSFDWTGKKAVLLTDSDIIPSHPAYDAFPRLAEQLYRLGAEEVRVLALPNLTPKGQKTGLDEFIIAKGDQAVTELRAWVESKEPQHNWRRDIKELGELADKSTKDGEGFDVELPFTTLMLDALAHDYRDKNTFGNIYTTLTKAKPKPSITELKQRVKDQLRLQAAKKIRIVDPAQQKTIDPAYDVPLKLLEGTNYQIIDKAMWKVVIKESKNSKGETVRNIDATPICHFVIWPVRKIQKSDGAYLELEGILPNGIPMKKFVVSMKDFHKMEWLGPAWHIGAEAVEPGKEKELRNCLGIMGQDESIPEIYVCTNTGWQKDDYGVWVFLHADGGLNEDN